MGAGGQCGGAGPKMRQARDRAGDLLHARHALVTDDSRRWAWMVMHSRPDRPEEAAEDPGTCRIPPVAGPGARRSRQA